MRHVKRRLQSAPNHCRTDTGKCLVASLGCQRSSGLSQGPSSTMRICSMACSWRLRGIALNVGV